MHQWLLSPGQNDNPPGCAGRLANQSLAPTTTTTLHQLLQSSVFLNWFKLIYSQILLPNVGLFFLSLALCVCQLKTPGVNWSQGPLDEKRCSESPQELLTSLLMSPKSEQLNSCQLQFEISNRKLTLRTWKNIVCQSPALRVACRYSVLINLTQCSLV